MKKNIFLLLIMILFSLSESNSQDNSFVYMDQGKFYLDCEEFNPMAMNYSVAIMKSNNNSYHVVPDPRYGWYDSICSTLENIPPISIGSNPTAWDTLMRNQFRAIYNLGFNTVRMLGLGVKHDSTNDYLAIKYRWNQQSGNSQCYKYHNTSHLPIPDYTTLIGDLYQNIIDIINEDELPLKLILVPAGQFHERKSDTISSHYAYLANRFKDESAILAYDLYNEANYWYTIEEIPYISKYETARIINRWCDSIRRYAPSHLITYGPHIYDYFDWDPENLNIDFVSLHQYARPKLVNNHSYSNGVNRFLSAIKYYGQTQSKPWIIGETGLSAAGDPSYIVHESIKSEAEQLHFAESSLRYSNYYNAKGYSWWMYKDLYTHDSNWVDGNNPQQYFWGLEEMLSSGEDFKPAAEAFSQEAFSWEDDCDTCTDLSYNDYYNPWQLGTFHVSGTVEDLLGNPIEGALIKYHASGISPWGSYWTYSDNLGNFKAYCDTSNGTTISLLKCSYPGMTLDTVANDSTQKSGTVDFHLTYLNQDSIPDKTIWYPTRIDSGEIVTWSQPMVVAGQEVRVKPYGKLIIKSKVYLGCNQKIIVERGGELEIDGGHLNSMNGMWQGIEVWGRSNYPKDSINAQGKVLLKNEAIIENAVIGIRAIRPDDQAISGMDPNYSGGIVIAKSGSVFRNCTKGVYFAPYSHENASEFSWVTFETTDSLLNPTGYPNAGVYMIGVSNIDFKGCTFKNTRDPDDVGIENRGEGIHSMGSKFFVRKYEIPHSQDILNSFENLHYGIYSTFTTSNKFMIVENSNFIRNWRAIYASAMDAGQITEDSFLIDQPYEEDDGCGLYLDNCTGYQVEANHFYSDSATTGIGIVVNNSGGQANEIYRNSFDNLDMGISAQGVNKDPRSMTAGLEILCNQFDNCTSDIIVPDTTSGIALHQGRLVDDPEDMAGNLFHIESQTPDDDYDDLSNQADYFYYYYPFNPAIGFERSKPIDFTQSTIGDTNKVLTNDWTYSAGCPSQLTSGGETKSSGNEIKDMLVYYTGQVESLEATLVELIDGGNTQALNTAVEFSAPPEAFEVYNELMMEAPFVSETVVGTSIEKETVLPNAMVRDIMVANPHSTISQELMDKLDERYVPMPDYMKAQVLMARETISLKTELESKLSGHKLRQARAFNRLLRRYLSDTINQQAAYDSIVELCQVVNSKSSEYRLAIMYLHNGEYEQGNAVLNNIPILYDLSTEELSEHSNMLDYFTLFQGIQQDGRTELETSEQEIMELLSIEQTSTGIAGAYARNILYELNQIEYVAPIKVPDLYKSTKEMQEYTELLRSKAPAKLAVFPNPAHDFVIIEYHLEVKNEGIFEIKDVNGNLMKREPIHYLQDQVTVNTRGWPPGLYIATLKIDGKPVESCKFTHVY